MNAGLIQVDEKSKIPLFGIDFLGIIDRGTNVIEIKPNTTCNLKCRYCFVNSGNYTTDFIVAQGYILQNLKLVLDKKPSCKNIEIHFSPYGEILLYPELFKLIENLRTIKQIHPITLQSNGILLKKPVIDRLNELRVTRINISLNTLNQNLARYLCNQETYELDKLLEQVNYLLTTDIDILFAPVWFPGINDKDIEDIIKYVKSLRQEGYSNKKIQIGIQKYLIYSTGRKLKKIRPKSWGYFYSQLERLEKKHEIKLKLGPKDFGIHPCKDSLIPKFKKNQYLDLIVISKGRWKNECLGYLKNNPLFGIKILLNSPLSYSDDLIGKEITARIIKANYKTNILTACFPP
ncbi:MAG: radical SAM protein [Promethearchaeota archaeon]